MLSKRKAVITVSIVLMSAVLLFYSSNGFSFARLEPVEGFEKQNNKEIKSGDEKRDTNMNFTIDQLTRAVLENNISLVNQIIESGSVDINSKDSQDQYPIEMVLIMNNCDMARILLEAGADPYVITSSGRSVYDIVMEEGSKYLKKIFREYSR